jgi:hypothetical protein
MSRRSNSGWKPLLNIIETPACEFNAALIAALTHL